MSDLISRQAAIDAIFKCTDIFVNNLPPLIEKKEAYDKLSKLPSVQEQRWIPVTERLPEKFQACIVTDERRKCAYEYDYNPEYEFTKKYGWRCSGRKIIAWMPLPEPYKEEK